MGPANPEPVEKPNHAIITSVTLNRFGIYSAVSASAFGTTPPRPSPVAKRIHRSSKTVFVTDVSRLHAEKKSKQPMIIGLRPIRSAKGANAKVPSSVPRPPAANTVPSAAGFTAKAALRLGATYEIAWVSKPSTNMAEAHRRRTQNWKGPKRCSSISCATSTNSAVDDIAGSPISCPPYGRCSNERFNIRQPPSRVNQRYLAPGHGSLLFAPDVGVLPDSGACARTSAPSHPLRNMSWRERTC